MLTEPLPLELEKLGAALSGPLILPRDAGYDSAREIFNAIHGLRPAAIARVSSAQDVAIAVRHAGEQGSTLAIRGGGHSMPGFSSCDGGLTIDLRSLSHIEVRPNERLAVVGGGATWGQLNDAAHVYGLATPGGVISSTGVGGLTLGGGIGYLSRQYGLACDNLVAAQVVTADGSIIRCDRDVHADLFWGIRGGGGNFGVVTQFEFRLHEVGHILGGPTFFLTEPGVLAAFRELMATAPRQLGALLGLTRAPALPFIPLERHGEPVVALLISWTGDEKQLEQLLRPLDTCGTIIGQAIGPMPYPMINTLFDDLLPFGLRHYWRSLVAHSIPDEVIDVHVRDTPHVPTVESGVFFHPIDGACHDVDTAATAFPHRQDAFIVGIYGSWHNRADDDRNRRWVRNCFNSLRPHYVASEYVNFAPAGDRDAVRMIYRGNYDRLARIKRRHDPSNLFRLNQNVAPAVD